MKSSAQLAARVRRASTRPRRRSPTRSSISTAEVERRDRASRRRSTTTAISASSASGTCSRPAKHPERRPAAALPGRRGGGRAVPDRLRRLELRRRRDGRRRAARRDAPERARRSSARKLRGRGLRGDDPRRGRARPRHRPRRDHRARRRARARDAARRRAPARRRGARSSRRPATGPTCSSIYGIAREVAALFGGELAAAAGRAIRSATATSRSTIADRRPRGLPALHRARSSATSRSATSPPWLRARLARAPAMRADLERRRRDELRHARARQPAARLRPRPRSPAGGSSCAVRASGEKLRTLDGDRAHARAPRIS